MNAIIRLSGSVAFVMCLVFNSGMSFGQNDIPAELRVKPEYKIIEIGEAVQLRAIAIFRDGNNEESTEDVTDKATWSSADDNSAEVDDQGYVTSKQRDRVDIIARYKGLEARANLTIDNVTAIRIEPLRVELEVGESFQLEAIVNFNGGPDRTETKRVMWRSLNPSRVSVSPEGEVMRLSPGTAEITAMAGDQMDSAMVTDPPAPPCGDITITVEPANRTIEIDEELPFRAFATCGDGPRREVTDDVSWRSSEVAVATINDRGLAIGRSGGTTNIIAALQGVQGVEGRTALVVAPARAVALEIEPTSAMIEIGDVFPFRTFATFSNGPRREVTNESAWQSSDPAIATVNAIGMATGESAGRADIIARFRGLEVRAALIVADTPPDRLTVEPGMAAIEVGDMQQFRAFAAFGNAPRDEVTSEAMWQSSDPLIAEVNETGEATGIRAGPVTITASFGGLSAEAQLTVHTALMANAGLDQTVFAGQTVTLDGSGSQPESISFAWDIAERPRGSDATLSDVTDIMPTFVADEPGVYRIELRVTNALTETRELDEVIITAVPPAVIAQGVGLQDGGPGDITIALPGPPQHAFLTWQRRDGRRDNRIEFSNGNDSIEIRGTASADPDRRARDVRCFYAEITDHIVASSEAVTYTVTHRQSIPGAAMVVIASELEATIDETTVPDSGALLETISRVTLGTDTDPRWRAIEIKAGCDFFHHENAELLAFNFDPSNSDRAAKITLLVGDAQSNNPPRRSELDFISPAGASPMRLGKEGELSVLIANDGCHWDTFGRNSGAEPPVVQCQSQETFFEPAGDPDRRGEIIIPANATSAGFQLRSPSPAQSGELQGVSAILSLAVFELVLPSGQ